MEQGIRSINISDAVAVRDIYAPYVFNNVTSFEAEPPSLLETERRIVELTAQYPWLVFARDRKVLGYAYASPHRARQAYQWCVEVSVYVDSSAHHCGVGRALYTALFELLRLQGYVNAYAGITLPNPASVGLHESLGFTTAGVFHRVGFKLGQWHDVVWLQLRLQEASTPISELEPPGAFAEDNRIVAIFQKCAQGVRLP